MDSIVRDMKLFDTWWYHCTCMYFYKMQFLWMKNAEFVTCTMCTWYYTGTYSKSLFCVQFKSTPARNTMYNHHYCLCRDLIIFSYLEVYINLSVQHILYKVYIIIQTLVKPQAHHNKQGVWFLAILFVIRILCHV